MNLDNHMETCLNQVISYLRALPVDEIEKSFKEIFPEHTIEKNNSLLEDILKLAKDPSLEFKIKFI